MKVLLIGGSRNVGYYAAQRLLQHGATVTFLLRNKTCFDADDTIQPYIVSGKARIVQGDALNEQDVLNAWETASEGDDGAVDTVLFTVGGTPSFSLTKGAVIDPPDLCTHGMLNLLATFPRARAPQQQQPRLVCVSSAGVGHAAHAALPLPLRALYGYLLRGPHADKLGMERVVAHAAGRAWPAEDRVVLPDGWEARAGGEGWLRRVLVVRPALFTDGACQGDVKAGAGVPYRVSDSELKGGYRISRRDVAHFIVNEALADWPNWEGKIARIAY